MSNTRNQETQQQQRQQQRQQRQQQRQGRPLIDPMPSSDPWGKGEVRFSKEEIRNMREGEGEKGGRRWGFGNNGMVVWRGLRLAKQEMIRREESLTSAEKAAEKLAKLLAGLTAILSGSFASGSVYFIDRQTHKSQKIKPPPLKGRYGLLGLMVGVGAGIGFQVGSMRFGYIFTTMSRPDSPLLHCFRRSIASLSPHHPLLGIRVAMPDNDESEKKILDALRQGVPLILNDVDAERYEKYKMRQEERGLLSREEEISRELEREHQMKYEQLTREKKEKKEMEERVREQMGEEKKPEGDTKRRMRRSRVRMEKEKEKEKERIAQSWEN